jgi:hypothetical protein
MKKRLAFLLFVTAIAVLALAPSRASAGWGWCTRSTLKVPGV